jgi:DNA-binding GntR family transcriptional regulator
MPIAPSNHGRPRTKQAFVYQTLRDAIMHCEIAPGGRLVIDELAKRLHVSAIPVREALQSLTSEGLVLNVPHVGATVAPITRESILDVFTLLEGLGGMAMRVLAERGCPGDFEALDQILRDMDDELAQGRVEEWASRNTTFHTTIAERTGLPLLREMTEKVHDRWHRVRRYYFRGVLAHRADVPQAEHWQMLAAMKRKDYDRLFALAHEHSRGALESYLSYLGTGNEQPPVHAADPRLLPEVSR